MDIKIISVEVDSNAILPTLLIGISVDYYYSLEAPINISGRLNTSDGKMIALLNESQINSETSLPLKIYSKETKDKLYESGDKYKNYYNVYMAALLSPKAIEHIESLREKNHEKATIFHFNFLLKYYTLPGEPDNMLSQNNPNSFLSINIKRVGASFIIKQSDWVNKYSTALGLGTFVLLELPILDKNIVPQFWSELYDRLFLRVQEMQDAIRHGDWQKVMTKARQFYENLKFDLRYSEQQNFKNKLKELFINDQHSEEGFEEFINGISNFFNYASKFIHDKNRAGQFNPVPIPKNEDAYFVYSLAIVLLNVIGKKLHSFE